ncbi:MAG: hypothetical protein P4K94_01525 [Terracidiphilus sp.]|nr:hypothetical protein [Terracidiphilus sp.]
MQDCPESTSQQNALTAFILPSHGATPDSLRQLEVDAILAQIRSQRQQEKHKQFLLNLARLWPAAVGAGIACCAPQLRDMVSPYQPWGMWILFPFVAIAKRPEMQLGGEFSRILPQFLLYAQFPLEGLLARILLKKQVTLPGVARHIFYFHFLAAAELCLVSGVLWQITFR